MTRRPAWTPLIVAACIAVPVSAHAEESAAPDPPPEEDPVEAFFGLDREVLRFDLGGTGSLYTAAAEVSTNGESNQQLVNDFNLGLYGSATYRFWGPFSVGWFGQFDIGRRDFGRFDRVDPDGVTALIERQAGGPFWEVWTGPMVRVQWRSLYLEAGWGALGFRGDDLRDDLVNVEGEAGGTFRTTPSIAWQFGIGTNVEIAKPVLLALRLNYRIRYYETRGGEELAEGLAHGTQDILPFIGFAYRLDDSVF